MSILSLMSYAGAVLREYIECACDGLMACSTCQVIVDPEWFDAVGAPSEAEMENMTGVTPSSAAHGGSNAAAPRWSSSLQCDSVRVSSFHPGDYKSQDSPQDSP